MGKGEHEYDKLRKKCTVKHSPNVSYDHAYAQKIS